MPFTISHAAAALPLRRTRLPLAALMVGSMAPDFAYFLPWNPDRLETHSFAGLFTFCWPAGLMVWLLFVHVLEEPTIALLPPNWRAGVTRSDCSWGLRNLALVSLAVILGAITHDVWDGFTHGGTPIVERFRVLHAAVTVFGVRFRLFYLLQIVSSVGGLVALAWWALKFRQPRVTEPAMHDTHSVSNRARVMALLAMMVMSGVLAFAGYAANADMIFPRRMFHFAVGAMSGWALAWFAVAIAIRARPQSVREIDRR